MKKLLQLVFNLFLMIVFCGCATVKSSIPVAVRTPAYCGSVKLYGTENVPFEYEELGVVSLLSHDTTSLEEKISAFVGEAQKLGADAIVNFMAVQMNDDVGVILGFGYGGGPCKNYYRLTGVAVKTKRP